MLIQQKKIMPIIVYQSNYLPRTSPPQQKALPPAPLIITNFTDDSFSHFCGHISHITLTQLIWNFIQFQKRKTHEHKVLSLNDSHNSYLNFNKKVCNIFKKYNIQIVKK